MSTNPFDNDSRRLKDADRYGRNGLLLAGMAAIAILFNFFLKPG